MAKLLNFDQLSEQDTQQIKALKALPEKGILFGTGNFIRAFVGYYIDKANKEGRFGGRLVCVQSTGEDTAQKINAQDGLFLHKIEGIENGEEVDKTILNASMARSLSALTQWEEVLDLAKNPAIEYIFSNTTESGIKYEEDSVKGKPPKTYPAKLLALLHRRFEHLGGTAAPGFTVLPCELILDNGDELLNILMRLADHNDLSENFKIWMHNHCYFCNTLVDRIVPGKPEEEKKSQLEATLGYKDGLMISSEPYIFFAIQAPKDQHLDLPWAKGEDTIVVADDIAMYRERKLRLLNGVHTISVGLSYLCGVETVKGMTEDEHMSRFLNHIMYDEIIPAMDVDKGQLLSFANQVMDRFRNPHLHHKVLNITFEYTSKMRTRNADTIVRFARKFKKAPVFMTLGFAAYLYFTRPETSKEKQWFGLRDGAEYLIKDSKAQHFADSWQGLDLRNEASTLAWVKKELKETSLWPAQLAAVTDFAEKIAEHLMAFEKIGVKARLKQTLEIYQAQEA